MFAYFNRSKHYNILTYLYQKIMIISFPICFMLPVRWNEENSLAAALAYA